MMNNKEIIASQQAINRKLWAKENGRMHSVDANRLIAEFMMNEQVMTSFIEWAERVEKLTQENSLINSRDILHDVFGMLQDNEHFLPRL